MREELNQLIEQFDTYTASFLTEKEIDVTSIRLKIVHTKKVLELGNILCSDLRQDLIFPLQVACLFHDLGRFEQIKQYQLQNETLAELRNSLLPKLMSGEIRVK